MVKFDPSSIRLYLAPMEGVIDYRMRRLLTEIGGYDCAVTEFVRVTDKILPRPVFRRFCPELRHQGDACSRTASGVPVAVQLLGGDPTLMAGNAERADELGAHSIDINFGCPAKTVNRRDGGAAILVSPERVFNIVSAVRAAVSPDKAVTVKMRLGYDDKTLAMENVAAALDGGAARLAVHARTKAEGYKPPAHWPWITRIRERMPAAVPLVANGEMWTVEDWRACATETGCEHYMIGRGALARPDLGRQIAAAVKGEVYEPMSWREVVGIVEGIFNESAAEDHAKAEKYAMSRIKQWLRYLLIGYPEARVFFDRIKRITTIEAMQEALFLEKNNSLS